MLPKFEHAWVLILAPIFVALVWLLSRQRTYLGYSSLSLLKGVRSINLNFIQKILLSLGVILVAIALARPYREIVEVRISRQEGRELVFVLDTSGSMGGRTKEGTKLEDAKKVIATFVRERRRDRIGLIIFTDQTQLRWPLSFAEETSGLHDPILNQLEALEVYGGTDIGKALLAALDHFDVLSNKEAKGKAVILISDGVSTIEEEKGEEIVSRLREGKINIYWVIIREGVASSYNPESYYVRQIKAVADLVEGVGGKVFETTPEDLAAAIAEVGKLEAAPIVTVEEETSKVYYLRPLLLAALALLIPAAVIELVKEL